MPHRLWFPRILTQPAEFSRSSQSSRLLRAGQVPCYTVQTTSEVVSFVSSRNDLGGRFVMLPPTSPPPESPPAWALGKRPPRSFPLRAPPRARGPSLFAWALHFSHAPSHPPPRQPQPQASQGQAAIFFSPTSTTAIPPEFVRGKFFSHGARLRNSLPPPDLWRSRIFYSWHLFSPPRGGSCVEKDSRSHFHTQVRSHPSHFAKGGAGAGARTPPARGRFARARPTAGAWTPRARSGFSRPTAALCEVAPRRPLEAGLTGAT